MPGGLNPVFAPPAARLFFALWPPPAARAQLTEWTQTLHAAVGGKPPHPEDLHLTLVFLGGVPAHRLPELRALAAAIPFSSFRLTLARAGCWKRNRVAWCAPEAIAPLLARLVTSLEARLTAEGFAYDRRPFAPHVTLARNARCPETELSGKLIHWPVKNFVLAQSRSAPAGSPRYDVIGSWPELSI